MPKSVSADRPMSVHSPIAAAVYADYDAKLMPVLTSMSRREAGVKLGVDPSALNHYLKVGESRISLPTLPQLERLAALAGFRLNVSFTKDATASERILGAHSPESYAPLPRGRRPATEEEKAAAAKVKAKAEKVAAKEAPAKAVKAPAAKAAPKAKVEKVAKPAKAAPAPKAKPAVKNAPATKATSKAPAKTIAKKVAPAKVAAPKVAKAPATPKAAPAPKVVDLATPKAKPVPKNAPAVKKSVVGF